MPLSEELKQLIAENNLWKTRPTGTKWTSGKRWDRIQTVRKNLERLHEENEVQYAVFLTYPNPRGNPSHYLYVEGEDMKNLVKDERRFPKCFLELKPKWINPATFVLSETLVKRKRLHSDESMERDTEKSASAGPDEYNDLPAGPADDNYLPAGPAEDNDLPAGPADDNDLPAGPAEDNDMPAGPSRSYAPESGELDQLSALGTSLLHHSNVDPVNLIQEDKALFQNQEKIRFQNATEPFTYIVNNKNYRVGPARKTPHLESNADLQHHIQKRYTYAIDSDVNIYRQLEHKLNCFGNITKPKP
ncbi:hypothetical protein OUZ56_023789 [Daphnia magna]|uniref:Uncharacterized protein n=1 Tax=Daphnia magna TaxID=35525 RepID=A0ABR0AZI2_9CRUS|nr:hypothetical protein OUZ56_023789 [Daphnia magna]